MASWLLRHLKKTSEKLPEGLCNLRVLSLPVFLVSVRIEAPQFEHAPQSLEGPWNTDGPSHCQAGLIDQR
jgi:hypothetical protein